MSQPEEQDDNTLPPLFFSIFCIISSSKGTLRNSLGLVRDAFQPSSSRIFL